jgi:hypothetical protein
MVEEEQKPDGHSLGYENKIVVVAVTFGNMPQYPVARSLQDSEKSHD